MLMLAPLIDGMTTRDVSRRLTAAQALQLFEDLHPQASDEQLDTDPYQCEWYDRRYDDVQVDKWAGLPPEFVRAWGHFREPKLPLWTRVLRSICKPLWGYYTVQWIRRIARSCTRAFCGVGRMLNWGGSVGLVTGHFPPILQ